MGVDRCTNRPGERDGQRLAATSAAFTEVLLRRGTADELQELADGCRDGDAVRRHLRRGHEYREIISPLGARLQRRSLAWQFERLSPSRLGTLIDETRHALGGDDAVRAALRSGAIEKHLALRPINLELDVTNQCNLRCVMCLFSTAEYQARKRAHLSVERFAALAAEVFPVCHRVSLSYGTEPLLHRDIARLVAIACSHGVPRTYLNTNGMLLDERIVETMIEVGFGSLSVSIDAATPQTYARIRKGGDWDRLMANLRMVRRLRDRHGSDKPAVNLAFVLRRDNVHELPAFVDLAADYGAVGVNAMHMIPFAAIATAADTAAAVRRETNAALVAAHERAAARGLRLVAPLPFADATSFAPIATPAPVVAAPADAAPARAAPPDEARERFDLASPPQWQQKRHCTFPWNFVAIDAYGNVLPCGWWYGEQPLGNIHASSLGEIWRGPGFRQLRRELRLRRLRHACSICPASGMGDVNDDRAFQPRT